MKKVFISGGTGRVGSVLVERLASSHPLSLLVRGIPGAENSRLRRVLHGESLQAFDAGTLTAVSGDLARDDLGWSTTERETHARDLSAVVHLGALTDFADFGDARHDTVNVDGALRMAEVARVAGAPLIFVSTAYVCGAYDDTFFERPADLTANFRNPYERSKARAEVALTSYCANHHIPLTILRPSVILPEAPSAGLGAGPGPLVFLEFLSALEGRVGAAGSSPIIRYRGDENAALNLVALETVVDVLRATLDGTPPTGIFHLTAQRPTKLRTLNELLLPHLRGLRLELIGSEPIDAPDRIERALARHCRAYEPYLFGTTQHDRTRCLETFGTPFDLERADLARIYANHVAAWSGKRAVVPHVGAPREALSIVEYFEHFLPTNTGRRMAPGIETLTAQFTVSVPAVGIFHLAIENGVLCSVARADRASPDIDYESDAAALLDAVRGVVRPSELFFQRRVTIRGDLYRALSTATALEEFFKLHPFVESRPA